MTLAKLKPADNRQPLPRLILVTDERRLPDPLPAIRRLPPGSAVLLRHHEWPARAALARQLARICRIRRLLLLVANDWRLAAAVGAAGIHLAEGVARSGRLGPCRLWRQRRRALLSVACHSPMALAVARNIGADCALLSPLFPSRSHPGQPSLGPLRFALWSRRAGLPVIALGGVNRRTWRRLPAGAAQGWAAIDGLQ